MNHCVFTGHASKIPRVLEGQKKNLTAYFTLIVKRDVPYKGIGHDNIPCVATRNNIAKLIAAYVRKGTHVSVQGRWQNNNVWVDGEFKPGHELLLTSIEFLEEVTAKEKSEIFIELAESSKHEFHSAEAATPFDNEVENGNA